MKNGKKLLALVMALCLVLTLSACGIGPQPTALPSAEPVSTAGPTPEPIVEPAEAPAAGPLTVNLGLLSGPTGMGGVYIMEGAEKGLYLESDNIDYNVSLAFAPTELTALLVNGELDIAALPTNVAASLYNKTGGGVQIIALNTMGVLYILENGDRVQRVSDLAGKTIYAAGQGANPEYVLNYILNANGLTPGEDVAVEWRDSEELSALMASGEIGLCMLPVPAATAVQVKNADVRSAIDVAAEWRSLDTGSELVMGCIVARTEFINEHPEAVTAFLRQYEESAGKVKADGGAAALIAGYGIVASEAIAAAAIPYANLCCITGADIQATIGGYYQVLFDADPTSIGGAMPGEDFYYTGS